MKKMLLSVAALTLLFGATLLTSCTKDDTVAPVITLVGAASVDVVLGTTYVDEGATASDDKDGNLTSSIVVDNSVNANLKGVYTVTYTVSDAAGNTGTKTRTVNVKNSQQNMDGSYAATDDYNSDGTNDYSWTETVTSSSTVNNQLVFSKFAYYTACQLKINVTSGVVSYPGTQTYNCGLPPNQQDRTFSALSGSVTATVITVSYHEVDADLFTTDGTDVFTKQ
jgi:hypothetical protein